MLSGFVILYLMLSLALGIYGATKVNNSKDFVNAGRNLPLSVVIALVFATWFGAETVLGIPGTFLDSNLGGLISDPFGATFCLLFFALFLARPLYKQGLLTIGDFYRNRFGQKVEVAVGLAIAVSYLGWVSAQITALGLVLNVLTNEAVGMPLGIVIGAAIVVIYTLFGGMWSVAITTFVQMIVIVLGLLWISWLVTDLTDGVAPVYEHAKATGKLTFWPEMTWPAVLTFVAGFLTMGFGSLPQQDTFQRANAAKSEKVAVWGLTLGGLSYLVFAAVPIYLAYSAFIVDPQISANISEKDPQMVLPSFILNHLPMYAQVIFFGALMSVIMSTASGALLAPSVTISENVIRPFIQDKQFNDKQLLWLMRATVMAFGFLVVGYSLWALQQKTSIHHMVESAYKVTLVVALLPLIAGIYWQRANNLGAVSSIVAGVIVWIPLEFILDEPVIPAHFYGFFAAIIAMIVGSFIGNRPPGASNTPKNRDPLLENAE